jgi:hypothetical protein
MASTNGVIVGTGAVVAVGCSASIGAIASQPASNAITQIAKQENKIRKEVEGFICSPNHILPGDQR